MTADQEMVMEVEKLIATLKLEEQQTVRRVANGLRLVLKDYGMLGSLALALVGAELAARERN
jgi:hypothetical protein